jgi:CHASE3 domain sensor protein
MGIGAALIIVVIVDVISYRKLTRLIDAVDSVTHTYEILDELDAVLLHLQNAETGQRGYLITGEESYLEPYHAAIALVDQDTMQLRALIDDWSSHHQHLRLVSLTPLIQEKLAELEETRVFTN